MDAYGKITIAGTCIFKSGMLGGDSGTLLVNGTISPLPRGISTRKLEVTGSGNFDHPGRIWILPDSADSMGPEKLEVTGSGTFDHPRRIWNLPDSADSMDTRGWK